MYKDGRDKGGTPGMDILTAGEEFMPHLVWIMRMEVWEKAPLWNILTNKRICMIMPLCWGREVPVGFVKFDSGCYCK